ncbi:lysostaphin resistance A-like protein [Flindersiella endophytica]
MTTQPYEPYPPAPQEAAAREAGLPPVRWGLLHAVGSLAGFAVASFGVSFLLIFAGADPVVASVGATLVGWISLAGWPILVSRKLGNGVRSDLALRFQWVDIGYGLLAAFVVICAAVIFVVLYQAITGEMPTSSLGNVAENSTAAWQVVALIVLALGAPFVEELHFRGMWWSALSRRGLADWLVLVITSALFALVHLEPTRFLILLAAGLAAGFVRMITGRLGPSIATHFLINAIASIGLLALL